MPCQFSLYVALLFLLFAFQPAAGTVWSSLIFGDTVFATSSAVEICPSVAAVSSNSSLSFSLLSCYNPPSSSPGLGLHAVDQTRFARVYVAVSTSSPPMAVKQDWLTGNVINSAALPSTSDWSGLMAMAYRPDLDHLILLGSSATGLTLSALQMSPGSPQLLPSPTSIYGASVVENTMAFHSSDRVVYVAVLQSGSFALLGFAYNTQSSTYQLYSNSSISASIGDVQSIVPTATARQLVIFTTSSVVIVSVPTPTAAPPLSLPATIVSSATIPVTQSSLLFSQYFDPVTASFVHVQSGSSFSSSSAQLTSTTWLAAGSTPTTTSYPAVDLTLLPSTLYGQLPLPVVLSLSTSASDNSISLSNATIFVHGSGFNTSFLARPVLLGSQIWASAFSLAIYNQVLIAGNLVVSSVPVPAGCVVVNDTLLSCGGINLPNNVQQLPQSDPTVFGLNSEGSVQLMLFDQFMLFTQVLDIDECTSSSYGSCGAANPTNPAAIATCTNSFGGRSCACNAGYRGPDGESCSPCAVGSYKAGPPSNSPTCTPCPTTLTTVSTGGTSLAQCICAPPLQLVDGLCEEPPSLVNVSPQNGSALQFSSSTSAITVAVTASAALTLSTSISAVSYVRLLRSPLNGSDPAWRYLPGDIADYVERQRLQCTSSLVSVSGNHVSFTFVGASFQDSSPWYKVDIDPLCLLSQVNTNVSLYAQPVAYSASAPQDVYDSTNAISLTLQLSSHSLASEADRLAAANQLMSEISVATGIPVARIVLSNMQSVGSLSIVDISFTASPTNTDLSAEWYYWEFKTLVDNSQRFSSDGSATIIDSLPFLGTVAASSTWDARAIAPSTTPASKVWISAIAIGGFGLLLGLLCLGLHVFLPNADKLDFVFSLLAVAGIAADVYFIYTLFPSSPSQQSTTSGVPVASSYVTVTGQQAMATSLVAMGGFTLLLNSSLLVYNILLRQLRYSDVKEAWNQAGNVVMSAYFMLSLLNMAALKFFSAGVPATAALQWHEPFRSYINVIPITNVVFFDLGKLVIQITYIVRLGAATNATVASLVISVVSLVFGLINRAGYFAVSASREAPPVPARPAASDVTEMSRLGKNPPTVAAIAGQKITWKCPQCTLQNSDHLCAACGYAQQPVAVKLITAPVSP